MQGSQKKLCKSIARIYWCNHWSVIADWMGAAGAVSGVPMRPGHDGFVAGAPLFSSGRVTLNPSADAPPRSLVVSARRFPSARCDAVKAEVGAGCLPENFAAAPDISSRKAGTLTDHADATGASCIVQL
jgi:hypothetical protein